MTREHAPVRVAELRRGGLVESVHHGSVVGIGGPGPVSCAGSHAANSAANFRRRTLALGDTDLPMYPRSANKPLQALALVRAGLRLPPELLALACASHAGADFHIAGTRRILLGAGLDATALRCTADLPLDPQVRRAHLAAGLGSAPEFANCSGKHAAMLATCVLRGWPLPGYLDPEHPVQRQVRATVAELPGERPGPVAVDGCGAPLFGYSLAGVARAFAVLADATSGPEFEVAQAMRAHPEWVDGAGRSNTMLMRGLPGAIAKGGAEGVLACALPGGPAVAVKIADGGQRAAAVVLLAALRRLGVDVAEVEELATYHADEHGVVHAAGPLA